MLFRKIIQIITLGLFILLIGAAASSSFSAVPLDIFLRLDPSIALITVICARILPVTLIPAAVLLVITIFFGRLFCSHICPMGTTIEIWNKLPFPSLKRNKANYSYLRRLKYFLLFFLLGSAVFGVSFAFISSPISLITRFYGLLIQPISAYIVKDFLIILRPFAERLGTESLAFIQIDSPRFSTLYFILFFFAAIFALEWLTLRFWCRYLCPSGALLALVSRRPITGRAVSSECSGCKECINACPMGAIDSENPYTTSLDECITCRTCKAICPENAISFPIRITKRIKQPVFQPERRRLLLSGLAGAGAFTAATGLAGIDNMRGKERPGRVSPIGLLRPPASLPEADFLAQCVRCGECMVACPTNTLQPIWFKAGFIGLFSPALTPKRGFCNPQCHICSHVCPTGAITELPVSERVWAKTGTAVIYKEKCIAWEHKKSCMVCDEVCPFKAVEFQYTEGNPVPVPRVREDRCAGCGYCEHYCPVQNQAAIVVTPMGAIRISNKNYREEGFIQGLNLSIKATEDNKGADKKDVESIGKAPGFD